MTDEANSSSPTVRCCEFCPDKYFLSRNQLFKHIATVHAGSVPAACSKTKVALLVGYLPSIESMKSKEALPSSGDGEIEHCEGRALSWRDDDEDAFDVILWRALHAMETTPAAEEGPGAAPNSDSLGRPPPRPLGWSRVSSTDSRRSAFLSQPKATPAVSELVCLSLPPVADVDAWILRLNSKLSNLSKATAAPSEAGGSNNGRVGKRAAAEGPLLTVHGRVNVPPSTHAETKCDLRRFEALVPLHVLAPHLADAQPMSCNATGAADSPPPAPSSSLPPLPGEERSGELEETFSGWSGPWLDVFRRLKRVMKRFQGRFNWHNYSPGVLPHDGVAKTPKLLRFKHVSVVRFGEGKAPSATDGSSFESLYAVLSLHGNTFLRGQVQGLVGLAVAVLRGWLPEEEAIQASLRGDVVLTGHGSVPFAPSSCVCFVEGRFDQFENKHRVMLWPRETAQAEEKAARGAPIARPSLSGGGECVSQTGRDADGESEESAEERRVGKKKKTKKKKAAPQNGRGPRKGLGANVEGESQREEQGLVSGNGGGGNSLEVAAGSGTNWGGDWTCESCAQINFKRRKTCFKCKAKPKAGGEEAGVLAAGVGAAAPSFSEAPWFTGFVGHVARRARNSASTQRRLVLARMGALEASEGAFKRWAEDHEANADAMRRALRRACALAPPLPPHHALTASNQTGEHSSSPAQESTAAAAAAANTPPLCAALPPPPPPDVLAVYERTLMLLRAADSSGKWPSNSMTRARVIANAAAATTAAPTTATDATNAAAAVGGGGAGGTFAVGSMPPPLEPPRANTVFLDLMESAFELERTLLPGRPPSSTIAINRHAQFTPHTDSGSGAGQSTSLIVGLGEYSGGELVVEGEVHGIRYQPLEFSGWTQRHWTLPFRGERYSLVWFTPRGCEGGSGLGLCEKMRSSATLAVANGGD